MDYLDAVRGQLIPELSGRPLSVVRVLRGQEPFMQKNVPRYTPPWVRTIRLWAESSRREVSYALCDDRRTLLWFANQRAVEYHPTLSEASRPDRPDYLVLDIDPPPGGEFRPAVLAAQLVREALAGCGLAGAVKTSGAKGVHVFVPVTAATAEDAAAATRAVAARAQRLDPALTTTAFIRADRDGKVFLDSTRAGGATVVAAYSPRVRPGVPVSFPVPWEELDRVTPADFTVRTAAGLITAGARWAGQLPPPQPLPADLVAEGHTIPVARVQAMHEGKRRARARRTGNTGPPAGDRLAPLAAPGYRRCRGPKRSQQNTSSAIHSHHAEPNHSPGQCQTGAQKNGATACQATKATTTSSRIGSSLDRGRPARDRGAGARALARAAGRPGVEVGQIGGQPGQVGVGLGAHRPAEALIELRLVEAPLPVVLGQLVGDLGPVGVRDSHGGIRGTLARPVPPCP